jgi:predicted transcriptional regulator
MAGSAHRNVILLSIYPEYARAIMAGQKRVEFRRPSVCRDATHVLMYVTSPHMKLVGFFEVRGVHCLSPRRLWLRFGSVGAVTRRDFFDYFDGYSKAVAIEVGRVWRLEEPLPLTAVRPGLHPPQGFTYVAPEVLERLWRRTVWPAVGACLRLGKTRHPRMPANRRR